MKNRISDVLPSVHYLGEEPFSERLIKALFARKSMSIERQGVGTAPSGERMMLIDSRRQLDEYAHLSGFKVLLKNSPINSSGYNLWCKTPINENSIDNILFYFHRWKDKAFVQPEAEPMTVSLLENFIGNDTVQVQDVISEFIDNTSINFRLIHQSIKAGHLTEAGEVAHRMLSSVSYYDVGPIRSILKILENPENSTLEVLNDSVRVLELQLRHVRSGLIAKYF